MPKRIHDSPTTQPQTNGKSIRSYQLNANKPATVSTRLLKLTDRMSLSFWFKLSFALLFLGLLVVGIHQYKHGAFRRLRARWLRNKLIPLLTDLVNELGGPVFASLQAHQAPDLYRLFHLRANLEYLHTKTDILYPEERERSALFLVAISSLVARIDQQQVTHHDLDETILRGQRAVLEITEMRN